MRWAQVPEQLRFKQVWVWGLVTVIISAVSKAPCPPGKWTNAATGSRGTQELPLEGGQGFGLAGGGFLTAPSDLGQGEEPPVRKCMRVHSCMRVAGVSRAHTLPSTRFLLFPIMPTPAVAVAWLWLLLAEGQPPHLLYAFLPFPCSLSWVSLHSHPTSLPVSVPTGPCPPPLSSH